MAEEAVPRHSEILFLGCGRIQHKDGDKNKAEERNKENNGKWCPEATYILEDSGEPVV